MAEKTCLAKYSIDLGDRVLNDSRHGSWTCTWHQIPVTTYLVPSTRTWYQVHGISQLLVPGIYLSGGDAALLTYMGPRTGSPFQNHHLNHPFQLSLVVLNALL